MTSCATCGRALQPAWRFCIYCGAATPAPPVETVDPVVEPVETPDADPEPDADPTPSTVRSRPLPSPVDLDEGFDHFDGPIDLPSDDAQTTSIASLAAEPEADADADEPALAEPAPVDSAPASEPAEAAAPTDRTGSVNVVAVVALALGVLLSPLAALFGHLALRQLKTSGERGVLPARIAVVLGYVWLGAAVLVGIVYLATNA